jgi:hypothetical protein
MRSALTALILIASLGVLWIPLGHRPAFRSGELVVPSAMPRDVAPTWTVVDSRVTLTLDGWLVEYTIDDGKEIVGGIAESGLAKK